MQQKLTREERQRLLLLLAEAQVRGLPTPDIPDDIVGSGAAKRWPLDKAGYFVSGEGKFYRPTEKQGAFISDQSRFSYFQGSRGCVAPETLIGGVPIAEVRNSSSTIGTRFGDKLAGQPYRKGLSNLFRLKMLGGAEVKVTDQHRILSPSGWIPLSQVRVGDLLLSDGTWYAETGRERAIDFRDDYSLGFRLHDELYSLSEQVSLNILQQLHKRVYGNNAQFHSFHLSIVDCLARLLRLFFLAYQFSSNGYELLLYLLDTFLLVVFLTFQIHKDYLSRLPEDFLSPLADSFLYQLEYPFLVGLAPQLVEKSVEKLLSLSEFSRFDGLREFFSKSGYLSTIVLDLYREVLDDQHFEGEQYPFSLVVGISPLSHLGYQTSCKSVPDSLLLEILRQLHPNCILQGISEEQRVNDSSLLTDVLKRLRCLDFQKSLSLEDFSEFAEQFLHDSSFLGDLSFSYTQPPELHNSTTFFDKVQSISFDRYGEYWDLSVPCYEHYSAGGLYHHNSGKSSGGAQKALRKIMAGKSGAVMNYDFENFRFSTWPEFKSWIPWSMVVPSQRNRSLPQWEPHQPFTMVFLNGARVYCKGLKNPDSARGPNLNWLWYDESGRDPEGLAWQLAISGVRVGDDPQAWATGTPKGKSHWTTKFFSGVELPDDVKEALKDYQTLHPGIPFISKYHGTAEENKANLDPLFYASLLATYPGGFLRQQEVLGEVADEGGQIGDSSWFKDREILSIPEDWQIMSSCRYWDMAATEKKLKNDPDEAVGSLVHKLRSHDHLFAGQVAGWFLWDKLKQTIADTAMLDGPSVTVVIEQEPASGGKNQCAEMVSFFQSIPELKNHRVVAQKPMDRVHEANMWFGPAAQGHIWIIKNSGLAKFYEQVDGFLLIEHDDRVTSYSGAYRFLSPFRSWSKTEFVTL